MWKDQDGNEIGADAQYRAPDGTLYPSDFPKSEIPGLVWVEPVLPDPGTPNPDAAL